MFKSNHRKSFRPEDMTPIVATEEDTLKDPTLSPKSKPFPAKFVLSTNIQNDYYLIRFLFLMPTFLVVVIAVLLVESASKGITLSTKELALVVRNDALDDIAANVDRFLDSAIIMNHVSYHAWLGGKLNLSFSIVTRNLDAAKANAQQIRDHLYNYLMDLHVNGRPGPRSIYIATVEGLIILYHFIDPHLYTLGQRLSPTDVYSVYEIYSGTNNTPGRMVLQLPTYNPTKRSWWNIVQQQPPGGHNWSAIYSFPVNSQGTSELGITVSLKLGKDASLDGLQGVIAADFELADLDQFLIARRPTERSQILLFEQTGYVVATSYVTKLRAPVSGRFTFLDIPVPEFKAAGVFLNTVSRGFFGNLFEADGGRSDSPGRSDYEAEILGETWNLEIKTITRPEGIRWLIVLMVPQSDVTGVVKTEATRLTWTATIIAIGVSIVSLLTAQTLLDPLYSLKARIDKQINDIRTREKAWNKDQ